MNLDILCFGVPLLIILFGFFSLRVVKDSQNAVILRSNKVHRIAGPGFIFAIRFYEEVVFFDIEDLAKIPNIRNIFRPGRNVFAEAFLGSKVDDSGIEQQIRALIATNKK